MHRALVAGLALLLPLAACGDDSGADGSTATTSAATAPPAPPATAPVEDCLAAAEAYVEAARVLFEGPPSDELVEQTDVQLRRLDIAASADGCGAAYTEAVCDGLDELTSAGTLVIYQMLTAQCISAGSAARYCPVRRRVARCRRR